MVLHGDRYAASFPASRTEERHPVLLPEDLRRFGL